MSDPAEPLSVREGREGSRWYNVRPTGEQVAEWFRGVPMHDGLTHEDYVGGVTLIQSKEKSNFVAGYDGNGLPVIREREDLVYVPYVKVETRVSYFWKLMELHRDEWVGIISPVEPQGGEPLGLPGGFFRYSAVKPGAGEQRIVTFVGCAMEVRVYERVRGRTELGALVMGPPPATKIVPTATRWDVDLNAVMKAETGAIGRALGMAGMLVAPGSGVATAEDMLELDTPAPAAVAEPELPAVSAPEDLSDDALRARLVQTLADLKAANPARHEEFQAWAKERKLTLDSVQGAALRGAVRKAERMLDEAQTTVAA